MLTEQLQKSFEYVGNPFTRIYPSHQRIHNPGTLTHNRSGPNPNYFAKPDRKTTASG